MRRNFGILGFFAAIGGLFVSARGMGTIDRAPARISAPHRAFLGFSTIGTRSNGKAPIPGRLLNQRQRRKRNRQVA